MLVFVRIFLLALIFEFGVIYNLQGLDVVSPPATTQYNKDNSEQSITKTPLKHSNDYFPFEIIETDGQEEIEEEENGKTHGNTLFLTSGALPAPNIFKGQVHKRLQYSSCLINIPLFIIFHSWKFHL